MPLMPLAVNQTILFIGDSITHAHRRPEEAHDCYQLGCGYVNLLAAELTANHPLMHWRLLNRGECGDTVQHLLARWEDDCLSAAPAMVSILIGINDTVALDPRIEDFRSGYAHLLQTTRQRLPGVKLVVLEPFALAVKPDPVVEVIAPEQQERLTLLQPLVSQVAAEAGALLVPLQQRFHRAAASAKPEVWTRDGIHPSAAGHWLIAQAWLEAVQHAGWLSI